MSQLEKLISAHPFLHAMQPEHIAILTRVARLAGFAANKVIFRENDPAAFCYLIQEGRVALESRVPDNGWMNIQTVSAGEVLGWSWLFPPYRLHFQARALEPTRTICLNGTQLLVACENDSDFGYEVIKRVSQLLIQRLQAERQHLLKLQQSQPNET